MNSRQNSVVFNHIFRIFFHQIFVNLAEIYKNVNNKVIGFKIQTEEACRLVSSESLGKYFARLFEFPAF